jgi:catechol 2,3-dioxygenase-like lactoylglutathione lyase family enzyme
MNITALLRVARNVSHLESAAAFYTSACGFLPLGPIREDPRLAKLLAVERVKISRMRLGAQELELSECVPKGAAYPPRIRANDPAFQHIAIITTDIAAAHANLARLGAQSISSNGPAHLPGGLSALKFRDPDGHPLEFLQFSAGTTTPAKGYDHSAICVSNLEASIAFYATLGVHLAARQLNHGPAQDALDGLPDVSVDVIALRPAQPTPHVELLHYRRPKPGFAAAYVPADICADRLVFGGTDNGLALLRDPDGHVVMIDGRKQ